MSGMSAWVTSDTTRCCRAVTGPVRKSMGVTTNPPAARGFTSGRAARGPSESLSICAHSAPARDETVRPSVGQELRAQGQVGELRQAVPSDRLSVLDGLPDARRKIVKDIMLRL